MTELALFAGAGGEILGSLLLGHKIVGAVEINEYCCKVLEQRQRDGILERFPIFQTDIRDFIRCGYTELYKGRCDLISAGFPCQPFSNAGKRAGANDERNMWPETIECIRIIRPRYAFMENVSDLLSNRYFDVVLSDLATIGYDARWCVLSACAFGAPHTRKRLFILAYPNSQRRQRRGQREGSTEITEWRAKKKRSCDSAQMPTSFQTSVWDTTEADILGMVDGLGAKVDRIRATGNGQVPAVVKAAWHLLSQGSEP